MIKYMLFALSLVGLATATVNKLTLIHSGDDSRSLNCFSEIFTETGLYSISYKFIEEKQHEVSLDGPVYSISILRELDQKRIFKGDKLEGFYSFKNEREVNVLGICLENLSGRSVKVNIQIKSGVELNDFSLLPLGVSSP